MQEVELDLSHNNFFCPVTGQQITGDHFANPEVPSIRFIYLPEIGEFETIHPDLEAVADQIQEGIAAKEEEDEDFFDLFKEALKKDEANDSLVIYSISTSGMACGPVGQTVHIAIDMDFEVEGENDEEVEEDE